jgi:hypothetical protein
MTKDDFITHAENTAFALEAIKGAVLSVDCHYPVTRIHIDDKIFKELFTEYETESNTSVAYPVRHRYKTEFVEIYCICEG